MRTITVHRTRRQGGKTTHCLEWWLEDPRGRGIIVPDHQQARALRELANQRHGGEPVIEGTLTTMQALARSRILTWSEYSSTRNFRVGRTPVAWTVDNLDMVLAQLFSGVVEATATEPSPFDW